jgi:hypothetical protein
LGSEGWVRWLQEPRWSRTAAQEEGLQHLYLLSTAWDGEAHATLRRWHGEILECRAGRAFTMVTQSWEPRETRVLPRGDWQDRSGEVVGPELPHFLPGVAGAGERMTRLDLARWLVARENPLTARTLMNRAWKQFFGRGLSEVLDDLGLQGEMPSHPELLDWLAVEFMESGWDVKRMVRLLVESSAYRQSSQGRPELLEGDPENRWLARQNARRLEAEFVRDNALAIAGLIELELGGPSVRPYQPPGYYANLQFPDRDYHPHRDERQYRRGVYMHWQRTFLHPMLANFDAPSREECVADRGQSNTPQQALTLLNDPTFHEAARVLAGRLLAAGVEGDAGRVRLGFERAVGRGPREGEVEALLGLLERQRALYREEAREDGELAAWTSVARVILNLHETITVY